MTPHRDDRTLGEMFAELARETRTLIQQEMQLAKTELTEKASKMGMSAGLIVGGCLIAYAGLLAIVAAIVLVFIRIGLPAWAGSLLGGLLVVGIGYLLIRSGLSAFRPRELKLQQTIETMKENAQWLRTQTK